MLKGVDVYEGDNITNFATLRNQVEVLIQKSTQGTSHVDSLLQYRYAQAKANNFKVGFYHFAGTGDATAEAQHFLETIKDLKADTCVFLDIEDTDSENPNLKRIWGTQEAINYANTWINYVKSQGYKVGLYTGECFYNDKLAGNIPSYTILWIAKYGSAPELYSQNIASWQYTDTGRIDGTEGDVDLDYFLENILTDGTPIVPRTWLQIGDTGDNVKEVQQLLVKLGYDLGSGGADGSFGILTKNALVDFQNCHNIKPVTGCADGVTIDAINARLNEGSKPSTPPSPQPTPQEPPKCVTYSIPNTTFCIEQRSDGNMGIKIDDDNYLVLRKGQPPLVYWKDAQSQSQNKEL